MTYNKDERIFKVEEDAETFSRKFSADIARRMKEARERSSRYVRVSCTEAEVVVLKQRVRQLENLVCHSQHSWEVIEDGTKRRCIRCLRIEQVRTQRPSEI